MSSNVKSVLRFVALGSIFVVPFIVLLVPNSMFFPFITGKNVAFRILAEIGFAAWILLAINDPDYRPRRSWFIIGLGIFIAWMGLATVTALDPLRSFWSTLERMEGYVTLLHLGMYVVTVMCVLKNKTDWNRFWAIVMSASIMVGFHSIAQLGGVAYASKGISRIDSTLGNPTYLAIYALFHIFIMLVLMYQHWRHVWIRWVGGITVVLHTFILIKTGTRGSMLGLIGGLGIALLTVVIFERRNKTLRRWGSGLLVALIMLIGAFFVLKDTPLVKNVLVFNRLANISLEDTTTQSRLFIWTNVSWKGVAERPILGWGQDNFSAVFNKYYDPRLYAQEQWFDRSHNVLFDWAIAGGIPGLIFYCGLFGALLWMLWRPNSGFDVAERALLTGVLAGYTIHNLFVFDNVTSYILFGIIGAYIHARSVEDGGSGAMLLKTWTPSQMFEYIAWVLVPIILVVGVYMMGLRPMVSAQHVVSAFRLANDPALMPDKNPYQLFEEAITAAPFARAEALVQMYRFTAEINAASEVDPAIKEQLYQRNKELTEIENERAPEAMARTLFFYGMHLNSIKQFSEGEKAIRRALELSPTKQTMMFGLINSLVGQGKVEEALVIARTAYELDPSFDAARDAYAIMLIQTGNSEGATALIEYPGFRPSDRLINLAASLRDFDTVVKLWELRVEDEPLAVQPRASLAASLRAAGDTQKAIAVLEEAIVDIPAEREQFEGFIQQIRQGSL